MRLVFFNDKNEEALVVDERLLGEAWHVCVSEDTARIYIHASRGKLLYALDGAYPELPAVHILWGTRTFCNMPGLPKDWPEGNKWVSLKALYQTAPENFEEEFSKITCETCRTLYPEAAGRLKEFFAP